MNATPQIKEPTNPPSHPLFRGYPGSVAAKKLRKRLIRETRTAIDDYKMLTDGRPRAIGLGGGLESGPGGGLESEPGGGLGSEPGGELGSEPEGEPEGGLRSGPGGGPRGEMDNRSAHRPRWLVCVSGGKDSYGLLAVLLDLKWRGVLPVELIACNLDQGQPGFPTDVLPAFFSEFDIPYVNARADTYSVVVDKVPEGHTYCALCSRLRRGNLYRIARETNCDAVVLGHHADDILETFFLNLFYGGRLASMPPKLLNEEGDLLVLRPLAYCMEADLSKFADLMKFPIIPCNLCGSQEGLQRQSIKSLLAGWEHAKPGRKRIMMGALANVRPSHLMDPSLFDFASLMPANVSAPPQKQD